MAVHVAAGAAADHPGVAGARDFAACARLRAAVTQVLRHVLLRQGHDCPLFRDPDDIPQRDTHRLPLFPRGAHAAAGARRGRHRDADPRARSRRRGAAPCDRKRRTVKHLAGRSAVAGALRPGRKRARRAGDGRVRRSRQRGGAAAQAQDAGDAARPDAFGVRAGQRGRIRGAAGTAARVDHQPAALAGRARPHAAAHPGGGRGPVVAAERQDRLRAAADVPRRQVRRRHRRWRLDRLGDLRPRGDIRRGAAAAGGEFGAGALRSAGAARGQRDADADR